MVKKFFGAIILAFAFLFFNLSFNSEYVNGVELPEEIFSNAGIGEKKGYWAIVNYGADYVGNTEVTIDIQQEAIANESVNSIAIVEAGYSLTDLVHYERNINPEFASKIKYQLKNTEFGEKYITILLLSEFSYNPSEAVIVDKIMVKVDLKRNLSNITPNDILVIKEKEGVASNPYKVNVTLPNVIEGKGKLEDYVFKSVKYTLQGNSGLTSVSALYESLNNFYFVVRQNGTYLIEVEDVFGYKVTKEVTIDNLVDPQIIIEVYPSVIEPTNHSYFMDVKVKFFDTGYVLTSGDLTSLNYSYNGEAKPSIKENQQIIVDKNGVYVIDAVSLNGSHSQLVVQIDNIDTEAPFVQVLEDIKVYTESVNLFVPETQVFAFDNITDSTKLLVEMKYFTVKDDRTIKQEISESIFRNHLYTVRDIIIRYKVTDEAGNFVEIDSYVNSIDDTKPTIDKTIVRTDFYINDPYPTKEEIEERYGIRVNDNSLLADITDGSLSTKTIDYYLDFSRLPVDDNYRLNVLGEYSIFLRAIDEEGNVSKSISLIAEVRARRVHIVADHDQYIVYGDKKAEEIVITYHCLTRDGEKVSCSDELLEGDFISGELYILNAHYVNTYLIYYNNLRVPSDLYYLHYEEGEVFTIKQRTIKVIAHEQSKYYLDEDPILTYEIDMRVCNPSSPLYNKDYRCTFAPNTGDRLSGNIERYMGEPLDGIEIWHDEEIMNNETLLSRYYSEAVWFDSEKNVAPREILRGSLTVYEQYDSGVENYYLDFEGADFWIHPKEVFVEIKDSSKIYGEFDKEFEVEICYGGYPIEGSTPQECISELRLELYRKVLGETVKSDAHGNYIDYYQITGKSSNKNYKVVFYDAYLTILRRDVSIDVVGDLDEDGKPTGKYTIYYEDDLPKVEVYDSSVGSEKGLVNNLVLGIEDKLSSITPQFFTQSGDLVNGYVNGIGIYTIQKGNLTILDKNDEVAEYNYNVLFNPGQLEVVKKEIWIKIIKDLSKVYGDEDKKFDDSDLFMYDEYVILEANGRFIIEITPTNIPGEEPYIPRDNEKMKYHLVRKEGIYIGFYPITIEKLEGCENYHVFLFEDYQYEITKRDLVISIDNQTVIYREVPKPYTYNEGEFINGTWKSSLQYNDRLKGSPSVGEFRHVGTYQIGIGNISVYDANDIDQKDVTFNYNIAVNGGVLKIIQREVIVDVGANQSKQYGEDDPVLEFTVYYNGQVEEMPSDDYKGRLGREEGEVPGLYYEINWGTFEIVLNGLNDEGIPVGNYLITKFNNNYKFYIEKRTIHVKARSVTVIYGNDYSQDVKRDTDGGLAYNLTLEIDEKPIHDHFVGDLKILGEVDGVGEYTISCENIRIHRYYTGEDITNDYYNYTYENGTLTVIARTIKIKPHDGQFKTYGENDTGITFSYDKEGLMDPKDEFVGELLREPNLVNGVLVSSEFVGQYNISLGTLKVKTPSGKPNYNLVLDGTATFSINYRTLTLKADDIEIEYGDPYELTYTIIDGSLANNPSIGIVDTITGELNLDRVYTGVGIYDILSDKLVVSNQANYKYTPLPGKLIVNKKVLIITPSEKSLYKVYGDEDPDLEFTTNVMGVVYSGELTREVGENVGKYKILRDELHFDSNYDVHLTEAYFTIQARVIQVIAENTGKLFGTPTDAEPPLVYTYIGTLINNDRFYGKLIREAGESVGEYEIMQGTLSININYKIEYTPGIFTIYYANFNSLTIHSLTNNQYQVKGEEEEVKLYAKFNAGADESDISSVEWKIIKNEELDWEFNKDNVNNIISFFPSGSIGSYIVSATYKGVTAYYEVYVELSTSGNVYIRHVSGNTTQTLGAEERLTYMVIVPDTVGSEATVQWIINNETIKTNKVSNIYFDYTPSLGKGTYTVQARINGRTSEPLYFYVQNNNAPLITLNGDPVIYIEAKTGENYIEPGATVTDDIDGDITDVLVITGSVDKNVKGTYYIRYDAKDRHGNNAITVYRQVVVRDTTPPVVTLNGNKEIKLLYGQPYIEYGATAVDNYDGEVEVVISNPVIENRIGIYEVTYSAYDESGNRGTAIRYVEVIDNVSPIISLVGDEIMYVEVYGEFEDPGAMVEDNVDGKFVINATSFYYGSEVVREIDTSKLGTYYVHYDYKDYAGNIGAGKVRIVIVRDSTPPKIVLRGTNPHIIRYSYPTLNYVEPGADAIDNYDEYVPVTITGELGNELGSYFLYYNAIDAHGNIAETVTREIIVIDVENPIIHFYSRCPQFMTIEALYEEYDTRCDAPNYGIWVEDDYMADLEELQKRVVVTGSVDSTTVGTYTIKYDVKDMSGNAAVTLHRYVEVVDTRAPVITLKCEDGKACDNPSQIVEVFTEYIELGAIVYDRYDEYHGIETEVIIVPNVNVNKLGEYIVTYNATDSNGNKAAPVIRRVSVKDTTPPVITLIGDNPMTIERGLPYVEYGATAIDNYDGPMKYITIINAPSGMNYGRYEVVYKAIDSSGNIGQTKRVVNVQDTIPPIVLGVENGKYYKEPVSIYFIPTLGTDEVLTGWLNGVEISSPHFVEDEGIYELHVEDDAGNVTDVWFAIDTTPPLILGVKNGEYTNREEVEIYSNEQIKYYEYRYNTGEWIRSEEQSLIFKTEGTYRVYAVDMAENISEVVMFVIDRTAPLYNLTGVLNKGITANEVELITEENAVVAVNASYNIPNLYKFTSSGYYNVVIRDRAGNNSIIQFVINNSNDIIVDGKLIRILSQHDAINKVSISGKTYARNSGVMIAMPLVEGGFKYVSGKLFSESEYQTLMSGGVVEIPVSGTDDTYMFVGFVVASEELNKFGSQTVEGDSEDDEQVLAYGGIAALGLALIAFLFIFFLKRRRKQEEEEESEEETIYEDY